jgi:mannose-1-phosphate guanylyltransferase
MTDKKNNFCIIMAGGLGTRFWPMSRTENPKQFLDILGTGQSLIQQTFSRVNKICPTENIYIVTNEMYYTTVQEQIPQLKPQQLITEPSRRNTAPCIAYAAYKINQINPDAKLLVAPSDHIILEEEKFIKQIETAIAATEENDCLLTLGIKPTYPNTGYGYIQYDEEKNDLVKDVIYKVKLFTEKPEYEMAQQFIKSGDFLWNSGIFVWSLKSIIAAFQEYLPEMHKLFSSVKEHYNTAQEKERIKEVYTICKSISIDYGIMEKAKNVYVLPSSFGWSDLGTWGSLYEQRTKDDNGNAIIGKNVMTYSTKNCVVNMPKEKLVVLQGLEDYIVVESDNILLVCKKEDEQDIRKFVNDVKIEKGEEYI